MSVDADVWRAALRFEAEIETMRQAPLASGETADEAIEWIRQVVETYNV